MVESILTLAKKSKIKKNLEITFIQFHTQKKIFFSCQGQRKYEKNISKSQYFLADFILPIDQSHIRRVVFSRKIEKN